MRLSRGLGRENPPIVHCAVVGEAAVLPVAAFVTDAIIAKAVIYAAIKSDVRPTELGPGRTSPASMH